MAYFDFISGESVPKERQHVDMVTLRTAGRTTKASLDPVYVNRYSFAERWALVVFVVLSNIMKIMYVMYDNVYNEKCHFEKCPLKVIYFHCYSHLPFWPGSNLLALTEEPHIQNRKNRYR